MSTTAASEAGRQLSARRWGSQRLIRLAHEVAQRIDELPAAEREALREALDSEPTEQRGLIAVLEEQARIQRRALIEALQAEERAEQLGETENTR